MIPCARHEPNEQHRSNLDPILPGPCRPLVLLFNALCLAGGLLVRVACTAADEVVLSEPSAASEAAEATAAAAAALAFLAAGLVALSLSVCCPELPHPLGGPEVSCRLGEVGRFEGGGVCVCVMCVTCSCCVGLRWSFFGCYGKSPFLSFSFLPRRVFVVFLFVGFPS